MTASAPIMFTPESLLLGLAFRGPPFLGMTLGAAIREYIFVASFTVPIFLDAVLILGATIAAGPPTAKEHSVNPDLGGDRRMAQSLAVFLLMASDFGVMCFWIA